MSQWLKRLKDVWRSGWRGDSVHVDTEHGAPERLEDRPLAAPPVDVYESNSELLLVADVPGAYVGNTSLYWEPSRGLQIYVRRAEAGAAGDSSSAWPDWYRAFALGEYLDPQAARSRLRDGILEVTVPRKPSAKPVAIPVKAR